MIDSIKTIIKGAILWGSSIAVMSKDQGTAAIGLMLIIYVVLSELPEIIRIAVYKALLNRQTYLEIKKQQENERDWTSHAG